MTARVEPYSDAFDELAELEFTPRLERLGLGVDIERGLLALLRSAYMAGAVAAIAAYNSNLELMRLQNTAAQPQLTQEQLPKARRNRDDRH